MRTNRPGYLAATCAFAIGALAAISSPAEVRIACVGDSITFGSKLQERDRWAYPARLQGLLGKNGDVRNFGVSGATLLAAGNKPYTKQGAYADSMAFQPDVVFIKLGTNDSKMKNWAHRDAFARDYRAMIDAYRGLASHPRVILLTPIHAFTDGDGINGERIRNEVIPRIEQVARDTDCELIHLRPYFEDHPEWLVDGVHPNAFGTECISDTLAAYLKTDRYPLDVRTRLELPFTEHAFHGFRELRFAHNGRSCRIVQPARPAEGTPWIWRARFFGHEPQLDVALLERGFHVAYCDVANLYGNDEAIGLWDGFYGFLQRVGFGEKVVLEGMSRGGLIMYRWAAKNPARVACIYGDAPVCDFKSWPMRRDDAAADWDQLKRAYGFATDQEATRYPDNPVDCLEPLARAAIPLLHVVGQDDQAVPVRDNTDRLERVYGELGGSIQVIRKAGVGHHPHSLPNPAPLLDFVLRHTGRFQNPAAQAKPGSESRGVPAGWGGGTWWDQFDALNQLALEGNIDVLFLGDSITQSWTGSRNRKAQRGGGRLFDRMYGSRKAASFGISGDRTEHLLYRVQAGRLDATSPKVVVVMIGVNNLITAQHAAADVAGGIVALVDALEGKWSSTQILLLGPFPSGREPEHPRRIAIRDIHDTIAPLGEHTRVSYLDLSTAFTLPDGYLNPELMAGDFIHLSPSGYETWAREMEPMMARLLLED